MFASTFFVLFLTCAQQGDFASGAASFSFKDSLWILPEPGKETESSRRAILFIKPIWQQVLGEHDILPGPQSKREISNSAGANVDVTLGLGQGVRSLDSATKQLMLLQQFIVSGNGRSSPDPKAAREQFVKQALETGGPKFFLVMAPGWNPGVLAFNASDLYWEESTTSPTMVTKSMSIIPFGNVPSSLVFLPPPPPPTPKHKEPTIFLIKFLTLKRIVKIEDGAQIVEGITQAWATANNIPSKEYVIKLVASEDLIDQNGRTGTKLTYRITAEASSLKVIPDRSVEDQCITQIGYPVCFDCFVPPVQPYNFCLTRK